MRFWLVLVCLSSPPSSIPSNQYRFKTPPFTLSICNDIDSCVLNRLCAVEMFKVRMQGQYGAATDKRLRDIMREMWSEFGFRKGVMRGYWVRLPFQPPGFHDMQRSH